MTNLTHEQKKKIVANNVAKLLFVKGYTQVSLGKSLGVSHTTIQNYLNQVTLPDDDKINILAQLAGVTAEDFMTEGGF